MAEASTVKLELLWAVDRGWEDGGLQSRRTADEMDSSQSEWSYVTVVRVRVRLLGLQGTHRPHSPLAKLHSDVGNVCEQNICITSVTSSHRHINILSIVCQ